MILLINLFTAGIASSWLGLGSIRYVLFLCGIENLLPRVMATFNTP